jgi:hypothetical protein
VGAAKNVTSANGQYVLQFDTKPTALVVKDKRTGAAVWSTGQLVGCVLPAQLWLLANGDLVVRDRLGRVVWHSQSGCSSSAAGCYSYGLQVGCSEGCCWS